MWPLTGLPVEQPEQIATNPVIGIKVENTGPARPWVGLQAADIVFVQMVEGGMTRFHAVYHSHFPDLVGPVRSLRPMDAAILGQWNATLLASGGASRFIPRVEGVVKLLTNDRRDVGFHRDGARRVPHNVMVDLTRVVPTLEGAGDATPFAATGETSSAAGGEAAAGVALRYPGARSRWDFDGATGTYLRTDGSGPSVEADGTRISARNVVVLRVTTKDSGGKDAAGNPVPETILDGTGELHLFADGAVTTGRWTKSGDTGEFALTDAAGEPLVLAPGNTWVELLPEKGSLSWD